MSMEKKIVMAALYIKTKTIQKVEINLLSKCKYNNENYLFVN